MVAGFGTVVATPSTTAAPAPAASRCGPLDVAFALDDTGSTGGTIATIKTGVNSIVNDVVAASGGDHQLGLVTFEDTVSVVNDPAPGNAGPVVHHVTDVLAASAGGGEPEASDEVVNTTRRPTAGSSRTRTGRCGAARTPRCARRRRTAHRGGGGIDSMPGACSGHTSSTGHGAWSTTKRVA